MGGRSCGGEHLRSNGFELGANNPALCRSELVNGFCHGDDFVTAAAEDQIEIFGKMLQEKFDTGAARHLDKAGSETCSSIVERIWTHSRKYCQNSESEIECCCSRCDREQSNF